MKKMIKFLWKNETNTQTRRGKKNIDSKKLTVCLQLSDVTGGFLVDIVFKALLLLYLSLAINYRRGEGICNGSRTYERYSSAS